MSDLGNFDDPVDETDDSTDDEPTPAENPFQVGDPVMDAAQGRSMVVLDAPDQTVAEWTEANNYDLAENYANEKFDPSPDEPVVKCGFTSNVRSEPSKAYTYPVSRVFLIDAHHADDGRRIAERVTIDVLESLFGATLDHEHTPSPADLQALAAEAGVDDELVSVADELAKADRLTADGDSDSDAEQ